MNKRIKDKISELFYTLPSPYKEQALENQEKFLYTPSGLLTIDMIRGIGEAIIFGFDWVASPQGAYYWEEVYLSVISREFKHNNDDRNT